MLSIKLVKRWPVTTYALAYLIIAGLYRMLGLNYDENMITVMITTVGPIFGFMFWIPSEIFYSLNDGQSVTFHAFLSSAIGLGIAVVLDACARQLFTGKRATSDDRAQGIKN